MVLTRLGPGSLAHRSRGEEGQSGMRGPLLSCRRSAGNRHTQWKRLVREHHAPPRAPPHPQRVPEGRGWGRSLMA